MIEGVMQTDRTVQIFLSETSSAIGVFEVMYTTEKTFKCNCPTFESMAKCQHTRFVERKVKSNNGRYPLEISSDVTSEDVMEASKTAESFRMFLIKHGKIEVLNKNA